MQKTNVWPSLLQSDAHVSGPKLADTPQKAAAAEHNGKDGSVVHVLQTLHSVLDPMARDAPADSGGRLAAVSIKSEDALPEINQSGWFRERAAHGPTLGTLEDQGAEEEEPILRGNLDAPPDLGKTAQHIGFRAWLRRPSRDGRRLLNSDSSLARSRSEPFEELVCAQDSSLSRGVLEQLTRADLSAIQNVRLVSPAGADLLESRNDA
jgi:hypothetical protein